MPRPVVEPNIFGSLQGTVSASLLDQNFNALTAITNDSAAGWVNAAIDTGSTNQYIVTLNPPAKAYLDGFFLSFTPLNANTSSSSINVSGLGNIQILTANGSALGPQALNPGTMYSMVCLNGAMRVISPNLDVLIGEVRIFSGPASVMPGNWQLCNGQSLSRTQFSALFNAIGTSYGAADGNSFNVPNLLGRFPMHNVPAISGGNDTVNLAVGHLPPHNHGVNDPGHGHQVGDPGHSHFYISNTSSTSPTGGLSFSTSTGLPNASTTSNPTNVVVFSNTTSVTTQNTGSGAAFSILPPFLTFNFIIRALY